MSDELAATPAPSVEDGVDPERKPEAVIVVKGEFLLFEKYMEACACAVGLARMPDGPEFTVHKVKSWTWMPEGSMPLPPEAKEQGKPQ